jgi:hypothetical protein
VDAGDRQLEELLQSSGLVDADVLGRLLVERDGNGDRCVSCCCRAGI